jgi:hypothetical protein
MLTTWCVEESERKYGPGRKPRMSRSAGRALSGTAGGGHPRGRRRPPAPSHRPGGRERSLLPRLGISAGPVEGERNTSRPGWTWASTTDHLSGLRAHGAEKGSLNWAYMNSILKSWHQKGLHTVEQVESGDSAWRRAADGRAARSGAGGRPGSGGYGAAAPLPEGGRLTCPTTAM